MDRTRSAVVVGALALALGIMGTLVATGGSGAGGAAAATPVATPDSVSVSGTGSVEGVPNTLVAGLRIHDREASVQQALDATAADARKVVASLRGHGVAAADIRTTDVSLDPDYDRHGVVDGYNSSESLTVHIQPLTGVGRVLSAAATAAGNSVSIDNLGFDIADNSSLLAAARATAFSNAETAAGQYARLGGTSLGRVISIKAVVHNASPVIKAGYPDAPSSAGSTSALPVRPGQQRVSVTVNVVWALQ
jgi:hypothetical protein